MTPQRARVTGIKKRGGRKGGGVGRTYKAAELLEGLEQTCYCQCPSVATFGKELVPRTKPLICVACLPGLVLAPLACLLHLSSFGLDVLHQDLGAARCLSASFAVGIIATSTVDSLQNLLSGGHSTNHDEPARRVGHHKDDHESLYGSRHGAQRNRPSPARFADAPCGECAGHYETQDLSSSYEKYSGDDQAATVAGGRRLRDVERRCDAREARRHTDDGAAGDSLSDGGARSQEKRSGDE